MPHPTGRPFLYFLVAGVLLLAGIPLLPVLHARTATFNGLLMAVAAFFFFPFLLIPNVVFQFERQWIQRGSALDAVKMARWPALILMPCIATAFMLAWLSLPSLMMARVGPPRAMTTEETDKALATIAAWSAEDRSELSVLLAQLTWRYLPNPSVNAALSGKVRHECDAPRNFDYCVQGLRALLATGARDPDLAPVLVALSQRDPEVRANWRSLGFLVERGEIAHYYRAALLDMLGLLGPAAASAGEAELMARLSDREERSRWAAAGALSRIGSPTARQRAADFFQQNVPPLIESYRLDRSRRLRACLFLLRSEVTTADVRALALTALDDADANVRSCGAFLVLTSAVESPIAEGALLRAFNAHHNQYARDSIVAALEILGTPRAQQVAAAYTPWQPERIQRIEEQWKDRYFRLFGALL
jgi:hypothetical protein